MIDNLENTGAKPVVAITGAGGFLGSHLVNHFLELGYEVKAHIHREESRTALDKRVANVFVGEITDASMISELVSDADYVVHTVSNFRSASGKPESYTRINVEGTRCVVDTALKAGVKRLVHCSTIGVHGNVLETPASETSPFAPGDLYQETKLESEEYVRSRIGATDTEIVIIRPCSMYGPGDMRMLKMFRMLAKGRFFFVGPCLENFHAVYIDDVVKAFANAVQLPNINGEVFLIGGPDGYRPLRDYVGVVANAVDAPPPKITFPYWLFWYAAIACEALCVPFGIEPPLHRRRVRFYKNNRAFDTSKSKARLQCDPQVGLDEGMSRTVAWYRENNYL